MLTTYYNELDASAATWLRELVKAGCIAAGDVDERSIADVRASDLKGYDQCHFFAGISGWSYALRLAGWPDDRPVWTGSVPCQPFSSAGKRKGTADSRHLWPEFYRLIGECRPAVVFGEQVEAAIRLGWLDGVFADLEGIDYACGAAVLPAAGVGAPHIRHRIWWVADADWRTGQRSQPRAVVRVDAGQDEQIIGGLADAERVPPGMREQGIEGQARLGRDRLADDGADSGLGNTEGAGAMPAEQQGQLCGAQQAGFWGDFDFVYCRDGKARRVEPGTFPLAHGIPARVGRLRGYGNAIVPQVAADFIRAYLEC